MKFVRDQEFYWKESRAFAKARSSNSRPKNNLKSVAFFTVLFALPLVLTRLPEDGSDVALALVFSVASALVATYVIAPLINRMPGGILVASNRLVVRGERIPFELIDSAGVGTTSLGGKEFSVLTIQTRDGRAYLCGLCSKVDPKALSTFLKRSGVREPQV